LSSVATCVVSRKRCAAYSRASSLADPLRAEDARAGQVSRTRRLRRALTLLAPAGKLARRVAARRLRRRQARGEEAIVRAKWLAAVLGAAILECGAAVAAGEEAVKIGGIGPLSGGGTAWGLAARRGMQLAIDDLNAAGGIKVAGKTYTLELIMYDDQ
jgi:ABC-type branched-subunit amino acid transport system substrate-binding protein